MTSCWATVIQVRRIILGKYRFYHKQNVLPLEDKMRLSLFKRQAVPFLDKNINKSTSDDSHFQIVLYSVLRVLIKHIKDYSSGAKDHGDTKL